MLILSSLYTNYFGKDKPLRHVTQHFLVGLVGILITHYVFGLPLTIINVSLFFLSTFLIDIDGTISVFIEQNRIPEAKMIIDAIKERKYKKASILATTHHKKFNRLIAHNIIGLFLVSSGFAYFVVTKNYWLLSVLGGILIHFIFDIFDDIKQIGHVKNWLWPFNFLQIF